VDQRFSELLASLLPLLSGRPITPDTRLRENGLDSMQSVELLYGIEDTFAITLPDEALDDETFATAGALWEAVRAELDARDRV